MKVHCSNDDAGVPHVRLTLGARWIEIEHDETDLGADSRGWSWTTSEGEVREGCSSGDVNTAIEALIGGST